MEHPELSRRLKTQLDDMIDIAYAKRPERQRNQCKKFTLVCMDQESSTINGDCTFMRDGTSKIRILKVQRATYRAILLTTIHEVSHHIAHTLFREQGHKSKFYQIHLDLLFAAFDMGLLTKQEVIKSGSTSKVLNEIIIQRKMLDKYVPNPVNYKQDVVQIFVYHSKAHYEQMISQGYQWNSVDDSWHLETTESCLDEEKDYLQMIGIRPEDIKVVNSAQVVSRLRKTVCLYNVPNSFQSVMQSLGYESQLSGRTLYWQKYIDGDALPENEHAALKNIAGIRIKIT